MRQTMAFRPSAALAQLLLAAAAISTFVDRLSAAEDVSAVVPLVFELTVGTAGGAELHQEIVVTEGEDFRVVTQCTHGRWYVEGPIYPIVARTAHVQLKYGVSVTDAWNVATTSFDLPVDGFISHGGGVIG